jgi:hypothetical protein
MKITTARPAAGNEYTGTRCVTRRNGGHSDVAVLQSPTMIAGLCVCDAGRSCGFCVGPTRRFDTLSSSRQEMVARLHYLRPAVWL